MHRDLRTALHNAREKLAEYTDRLWKGREAAQSPLIGVYTERLASAARMAAMVQWRCPMSAMIDLYRREDRAFPRDLLATDAGREARSAFNALGRAMRDLEEYKQPDEHLPSGPDTLVGEQLSVVSFVMGYFQLGFNGPGLTVLCPVEIRMPNGAVRSGESGFCDRLCELIGGKIVSAIFDERSANIEFDGSCSLRIDMSAGPSLEKLIFDDGCGVQRVWT